MVNPMHLFTEDEIETLILSGQLTYFDIVACLDHPEWRSFSGGFQDWVRQLADCAVDMYTHIPFAVVSEEVS